MKKILTKIIGASLAIAMMIGVGAGLNYNQTAKEMNAASPQTLVTNALTGTSDDGKVSWEAKKGGAGTAPAIFNSAIRLYQNGGFIELKANGGTKITGFTAYNTDEYSTTANYAISENSFDASATPKSAGTNSSVSKGGTYSIDGLNSTYVAIICKGTTKGTRFEISSIDVTYSGASANPEIVFSKGEINGEVGDEFSFTYSDSNLTEDISWSPASNETDVINYTVNAETKTVSGTLANAGSVTLTASSGDVSDSVDFTVNEHIVHRKYTVTSTSAVSQQGDTITGSSAVFSNTYSTKDQLTSGKEMTLSISGLSKRVTISKLVFSMHSNGSAGAGYVTIAIDGGSASYLSGNANGVSFEEFGDEGTTYGQAYRDIVWDNLNFVAISSIEIKIRATTNSLYCQWFDIYFSEEEIIDVVTELSVTPNSWSGYDSQTINVNNFTVSVTRNGEAGTSEDYEFQGIGSGAGDDFEARIANFTSGHPALTDTRLQWKAKYPTEAHGSTYLYAYVTLTVTEDTVASLTLSGEMTNTTYFSTETWNTSGLIATATFVSTTETNVTSQSTFSFYSDENMTNEVDNPIDLGIGNKTVYIKATYSGISNEAALTQTICVTKDYEEIFIPNVDTGEISVSKNGVTISTPVEGGTFSRSDNYRVYAGKSVTISSADKIAKIVIISPTNYNTLSGDGYAVVDNNGTWTGSANSVTLNASSQARINKIIVTIDSAKYAVENTLETRTSLSYATYTHHDDDTYTYTDVAIRFGGKIAPALWDRLNAESTIEGYGVLLATGDLGTDSIEDWYKAYKTESNTVEEALDELVTDGVVAKYSKSVQEKAHPTQVGDVYSWNLYYRIGNSKAELLEEYTAVAYIKIHNSIVFLKQDTVSAKSLASDMLQGENPETYGGSLSYLAELQEGE